jgi:hypothetical protein
MGDAPNDPREQHEVEQNPRKRHADLSHPPSQAQQGISSKFLSCRNGPYAIRARTGSTSYELDCLDTLPRAIGIYDVSQLQPYHGSIEIPPSSGRPRPKTRTTPQEPDDSAPIASRYIGSEGETVGKLKYYPLRRMGSKNAPHYYTAYFMVTCI